ncbi:MAG: helix-turn-helix transcriptional regulator [Nitrospiraceae bacterium]|jgi:DNA-binding CsgD family transcriptional regulator|nr:helix-turn-helix transcriptional regulator [Nitrospiraceae bacterium]
MGVTTLSKFEDTSSSDHVRLDVGVIVLAASNQLRYRNQRAWELCDAINRYENVKTAGGVLPVSVTSLANEIRRLLQIRTEPKDWEQIQIRRVAGSHDHPVLLRGFGLIDADLWKSRIVIVMQETGPAFWRKRVLDKSMEKFQLTHRETDILQHLLKGLTNKGIAAALGTAEQTVKEHMKHLMAKVGTTTRTGIVMKTVLCGMHYETWGYTSESSELSPPCSHPLGDSQAYNLQFDQAAQQTRERTDEVIELGA